MKNKSGKNSGASLSKSIAWVSGLLMTSVGLITLVVFVLYECLHAQDIAGNVAQVVFAGLSGITLVLVGFATMVAGSPEVPNHTVHTSGPISQQ